MLPPERQRLDKWLWAARFFKTRKLAGEAISGGKVHLNGRRTKPGKEVQPGSRLEIQKGPLRWEIEVSALSRQRLPAPKARLLYAEDEASRVRREALVGQLRAERAAEVARSPRRPNKRERRQIHRFKQKGAESTPRP